MKEKLTFLDLWDINNKKITDFPKELHKGYKLRKEQSKYKFNTKDNSILNIFRNLQNQPSNIINPNTFCISIKKIFENLKNIEIIVKDIKQLKKENLNLVLSVDKLTSKMLIIKYKGNKTNKTDLALIGKGVTFDAGGYSLKPTTSMLNMNLDKTGGCMVSYIIYCLANQKIKKNIIGCIPLVQNDISHIATKPGDIVKSYSGIKVEITNTDAEGRLILADGISYCIDKYKPDKIIDMGTVTGIDFCKISYAYFTLSDKLSDLIEDTSTKFGEKLIRLYPWKEYIRYTKSVRGDIKNSYFNCNDKTMAALFLLNFIPKKYEDKWIHINLAELSVNKDVAILEGSESILSFVKKYLFL